MKSGDNGSYSRERSRFFLWGVEMVQTMFAVLLEIFMGSVSSFINLNQLLRVVVAVGVATVPGTPGMEGSKNGATHCYERKRQSIT